MTRVFFSYKRDDPNYAAQIQRIRAGLEAEGFDIFIDVKSIELQENWIKAVDAEIATCDVGLVIWTPAAARSDLVLGEAVALRSRSKYLGVLLAADCQPAVFKALQHCDLTRWVGRKGDAEWGRLVAHLRALEAAGQSSLAIEKAQARAIPISSDPPEHAGQDGGGPASYFRDGDNLPLLATVPIPGVFTMGAPPEDIVAELNEHPAVAIRLAQAFAISVFPITNADWNLAAASCAKDVAPRTGDHGAAALPVVRVSWTEAQAYVAWLNFRVGRSLYRLPSEAEWEYVARPGKTRPLLEPLAHPLSALEYAPNAWGIAGMLGNVWQWTGDVYNDTHHGVPLDGSARQRPDTAYRTARGGSWRSDPAAVRTTLRAGFEKHYTSDDLGFRVVRQL